MKLSIVVAVSGLWLLASIPSYADASGLPTGKRQHKPFSVSKPVDKSTGNPDRPVITRQAPNSRSSRKSKLKKVGAPRPRRLRNKSGKAIAATKGTPFIITFTARQRAQLSKSSRNVVTVRLTRAQYYAIKKRFPKIRTMRIQVTLSGGKIGANIAAPFVPGGSVVSAAISSISSRGEAIAKLSDSTGG